MGFPWSACMLRYIKYLLKAHKKAMDLIAHDLYFISYEKRFLITVKVPLLRQGYQKSFWT
jgi:hypothetical protein